MFGCFGPAAPRRDAPEQSKAGGRAGERASESERASRSLRARGIRDDARADLGEYCICEDLVCTVVLPTCTPRARTRKWSDWDRVKRTRRASPPWQGSPPSLRGRAQLLTCLHRTSCSADAPLSNACAARQEGQPQEPHPYTPRVLPGRSQPAPAPAPAPCLSSYVLRADCLMLVARALLLSFSFSRAFLCPASWVCRHPPAAGQDDR